MFIYIYLFHSHYACEEKRLADAKLLVRCGARLDIQNKEKKTPLDLLPIPSLSRDLTEIEPIVGDLPEDWSVDY